MIASYQRNAFWPGEHHVCSLAYAAHIIVPECSRAIQSLLMKPSELPGTRSVYRLTNRWPKLKNSGNMPVRMTSGISPPGSSGSLENTAHRRAALGQATVPALLLRTFPKPRWYHRLPRCRSGLDSPYLCVSSLPTVPSLVPKAPPSALVASVAVTSSSYSPIVTQVFYRTPMDQALATKFSPSLRNANERERAPQSRMRVNIGDALVLSQRD